MTSIEIFNTSGQLFKAAANKILLLYENAVAGNGIFTIALSGGNTPKKLYELLSQTQYAKKLDWQKVYVFWSDERCVPVSNENSNSRMASIALLNNIHIPKENIFPVPVNFEPAKAASRYEQMIKSVFKGKTPKFDLILLGLGEDGHTASLFPGSKILSEKKALVKQVYLKTTKMYRVSFTFPLINAAKNILFLVTGIEKAEMVQKIFTIPYKKTVYPAQMVNPVKGTLLWYLDKSAASQLKK